MKSRKDFYLRRVKSLEELLNGHAQSIPGISGNEFTRKLLARASFRFLEEKSLEDLSLITHHAFESILSVSREPSSIYFKRITITDNPSLVICAVDKPFIVSTIVEIANKKGVSIRTLLHPIYTIGENQLSLCIVECSRSSIRNWEDFTEELYISFKELDLICTDFRAMSSEIETLALQSETDQFQKVYAGSDNLNVSSFLKWINDGSFIICGIQEWSVEDNDIAPKGEPLGLLRSNSKRKPILVHECLADLGKLLHLEDPIWVTHLSIPCPIHRQTPLVHISIPTINKDKKLEKITSIVGIFTTKAQTEPSSVVGLIKSKLNKVLESADVLKDSHDHKFIVDMIDRMPKEEALRLSCAELSQFIEKAIDVFNRNDIRLILNPNPSERAASVIVIMPRERFSTTARQKIQNTLESYLGTPTGTSEYYVDLSAHEIARLYFYVPSSNYQTLDLNALEQAIYSISRSWYERLISAIEESEGGELFIMRQRYQYAFSAEYQASIAPTTAQQDISAIESMSLKENIRVILGENVDAEGRCRIDIFHRRAPLTLSQTLPVLEHAGFEVLTEQTELITPLDTPPVYVHRFSVRLRIPCEVTSNRFARTVGPGLEIILSGKADDDALNSLLVTAGLGLRSIALLRAYCSLMWQMNLVPRKHILREILGATPDVALQLWDLFAVKFDPAHAHSIDQRKEEFTFKKKIFDDRLKKEKDINIDRMFRMFVSILEHTVRTNFYTDTEAIAIKIATHKIESAPEPKPLYEIFVHSDQIEGVHLRSGLVSRGGLRWSERLDDFRTEVLGLVKTQKIKNVFIVPEGAKGGFVVRQLPKEAEKIREAVKFTYEVFIRTLLSVADNRVDGKIYHPTKVVCFDGDDPYFVVAADKGTATFSDIANSIACNEASFWLDDAFASGGSNGYDHKLYGITARGAWECVIRHFNDHGIDYLNNTFTAVGIGDMSGDVFGNGLLLSNKVQLVAAFNHAHIFVDPTPDPAVSFQERSRLFALPRSQWTDYNRQLISKGGEIFDRSAKEIELSPEARAALGIADTVSKVISGEELVSHILKATVDLLWNGGIGTYVKSSEESHIQANDSTNDRVRINADELRCRVVGEGGNLGFTQRARIEYATIGGQLNTDAIDNSGGVGLSDLEVNIKILFSDLVKSNVVSLDERNILLKEMADEVCNAVLLHNKDHAYAITSAAHRSVEELEYYKSLINYLIKIGLCNRALDTMPDDEELNRRATQKVGVFRPELSVILALVKMWIKGLILKSEICKSKSLEKLLIDYFPVTLRKRFSSQIAEHPLAKNIIATQATNLIVNQLGISYIHQVSSDHSVDPLVAIRSALAAMDILNIRDTVADLWKLDTVKQQAQFTALKELVKSGARDLTSWFIQNHHSIADVDYLVSAYTKPINNILNDTNSKSWRTVKVPAYQSLGLSERTSKVIAFIPSLLTSCDIIKACKQFNHPFEVIENTYLIIAETLRLDSLPKFLEHLEPKNKWEAALYIGSLSEVRLGITNIAIRLQNMKITTERNIIHTLTISPGYQPLMDAMNEIENLPATVAHLAVLAKLVNGYVLPTA